MKLSKDALFEYLSYAPHPAQAEVHRSSASRRVVASGVRVGKSTIGTYECVAYLLQPRERALGWLVAPTLDLTTRIFKRVVEVLHEKFPHRIGRFDPRQHVISVVNLAGGTSELKGKSADKPVSLLGESLDFLVVDECTKLRGDVWSEHLSPRVLDRRGDVLLLSTPAGPGWFFDEFRRGTRKNPDSAYACWSFPTSANPLIDPQLIEAERKRLDHDTFAAQYLAEFVGAPLEICETCQGPVEGQPGAVIVGEGFDTKTCATCNDYVYWDGRSAVGVVNGERKVTVIYLEDAPDAEIPLPI